MTSFEERFWSKVDRRGPDECWFWTAWCDKKTGYGHFGIKLNGRQTKTTAHRVAYELTTGQYLGELLADHTCFNHACCNPAHIRPATRQQNGQNRQGPRRDNSSGVLGVTWHKASQRWTAKVMHNGKYYWVGRFGTMKEAEEAVRAKRLELYTHNDVDRVTEVT